MARSLFLVCSINLILLSPNNSLVDINISTKDIRERKKSLTREAARQEAAFVKSSQVQKASNNAIVMEICIRKTENKSLKSSLKLHPSIFSRVLSILLCLPYLFNYAEFSFNIMFYKAVFPSAFFNVYIFPIYDLLNYPQQENV